MVRPLSMIFRRPPLLAAVSAAAILAVWFAGCGNNSGGGKKFRGTMGVNVWIVGLTDYSGPDDPNLNEILVRFKELFANIGIGVADIVVREITGEEGERFAVIDLNEDEDANGLPDRMEELFTLSARADTIYLNVFFVRAIVPQAILGLSSDIPGPPENGARKSGVLINSLGGLTSMTEADKNMQADTMAHEAGHYLGVWHTTEKDGQLFDDLDDTPECDAERFDLDNDNVVSAQECEQRDGPNLMFWAAAPYPQETVSPKQIQRILEHPLVTLIQ